ncbi:hypothetical protein NQ318_020974 [Aromia moschata]|uniref:Uncharacterized protein n=1 Tax=Aromia moschata TaxID=1265417 RepID=A0AAV8YLW1_9CUCU|nr:hypothetical protein NQ318_020974 [Aromia moschata]
MPKYLELVCPEPELENDGYEIPNQMLSLKSTIENVVRKSATNLSDNDNSVKNKDNVNDKVNDVNDKDSFNQQPISAQK